ncbi:uncharacterized protein LOC112262074 isoform X2 [Oncorhynchus tshawytscha]|uniref:uncharacterized protein LOC112262074 isoform X2 n=1 Tax=Oncorhynchus tshawytscha TaxID=74940 RepID=UPI000D0A7AB3|nr:uncharacterized protein LOC112262074 isoform X2 [Oncorhynchus tshawytscha]
MFQKGRVPHCNTRRQHSDRRLHITSLISKSNMSILGFLLVLLLSINTGIRAEPTVDQYGLKGDSICLAVAEPEMINGLQWRKGNDNLMETDSGIYMVNYRKHWKQSTTTYRLLVEDHVLKPVMDVTSLFNTSVGLCDVTVNCSVKDGWMLSVCDSGQCTLSQQSPSLTGGNMTISVLTGRIQCTSSNRVSTQTISQPMEDCRGNVKASVLPVGTIVGRVTGTGILLLVAVLLGVGYIKHTRRLKISKEQSPLEEVIVPRVYNSVKTSPGREEPQPSPVQNHSTLLSRTTALSCPEPQHSPVQNHSTLLSRTTPLSCPESHHSPEIVYFTEKNQHQQNTSKLKQEALLQTLDQNNRE